jgi:hypothetical protein
VPDRLARVTSAEEFFTLLEEVGVQEKIRHPDEVGRDEGSPAQAARRSLFLYTLRSPA